MEKERKMYSICLVLLLLDASAFTSADNDRRIVNGKPVPAGTFPYVALLLKSGFLHCGSSLIAPDFVLTAGHCLWNFNSLQPEDASMFSIVYNTTDLIEFGDPGPPGTVHREAVAVFVHPKFTSSEFSTDINDLGILQLAPLTSESSVPFALLPPQNYSLEQEGVLTAIAGWGYTQPGGDVSTVMMYANVTLTNMETCIAQHMEPIGAKENICASRNPQDACNGDSGAPMMAMDQGRYVQIGLVSWGTGCGPPLDDGDPEASADSVYTRVSTYMDFVCNVTNKLAGSSTYNEALCSGSRPQPTRAPHTPTRTPATPTRTSSTSPSRQPTSTPSRQPTSIPSRRPTRTPGPPRSLFMGYVLGDPHVTTFDGLTATYRDCGDYVLARSSKSNVELHGRFGSVNSDAITSTVGAALRCAAGGKAAEIYAMKTTFRVMVDGTTVNLAMNQTTTIAGIKIGRRKTGYGFVCPSGAEAYVYTKTDPAGLYLDVLLKFKRNSTFSDFKGLLGTPDNKSSNDVMYANGTVVPGLEGLDYVPGSYRAVLKDVQASWKVGSSNKLLSLTSAASQAVCKVPKAACRDISPASAMATDGLRICRWLYVGLSPGSARVQSCVTDYSYSRCSFGGAAAEAFVRQNRDTTSLIDQASNRDGF